MLSIADALVHTHRELESTPIPFVQQTAGDRIIPNIGGVGLALAGGGETTAAPVGPCRQPLPYLKAR